MGPNSAEQQEQHGGQQKGGPSSGEAFGDEAGDGTERDPGDNAHDGLERTDIVVGFDGSAPSRTALRYAITQARHKNAPFLREP